MSASDTQVGGTHYHDMGDFQPWDVLKHWLTPEEYRGYQKGVAIAYLARERVKGGDQDIAKAAHHLQKLLEVMSEQNEAARPLPYCTCAGICNQADKVCAVQCRNFPPLHPSEMHPWPADHP